MKPLPHSLILCGALLAAACTGSSEVAVPGPERATVSLSDVEVRAVAQILRLEDERRYVPEIFERLGDGSLEVRRRAAMAAGRIGDTVATRFLTRLLDDDPSPAVRADAAFALGELGDTSRVVLGSLRDAVPSGWVPVREPETGVVVEVIHALGKLGTGEARALVVDALRAAHPGGTELTRRVAAAALLSVWRFDEGPGRVNAVARYADVPGADLRWRAAYALMRLGEPHGAHTLLRLLSDSDHRARASAARGLRSGVADSAGIRDTALVALTGALGDGHPHVRINAVRALATYGEDAPVNAMAQRLDDSDPHVAVAAATALAAFADRAGDRLERVLMDPERPHAVRSAAAVGLAGSRPAPVRDALRTWSQGDFAARYAAARTLPALDWARAGDILTTLAADPDRRVAVAALVAAGRFAADSTVDRGPVGTLLQRYAAGDQPRLAVVAIRGLAPLVDSTELARLREVAQPPVPGVNPVARADRGPAFYEDIVRRYLAPALSGRRPRATIRTAGGEIVLELLAEEAPLTVHNFAILAERGYWDGGVWHRVVPNFVLQDGAPAGDPSGGPGWSIRDEINRVRYTRGVLGMALSGPDTGGSQWFITHSPQHHLDGGYTVFGTVIDGMEVADRVLQGDPIQAISIAR